MSVTRWLSLLFIIGFIIVHFSSKYMKLSTTSPRSPWLSFAGGATIAYVFLYLLPELNKYLQVIKRAVGSSSWLTFFGDYTYLLALFGLLVYYGIDITVRTSQKKKGKRSSVQSPFGVFVLHMSSFFLYNLVIGYFLVRGEFQRNWDMALYFLALAAHFIGTDHTLKEMHKKSYDKYGRWFLVSAVLIGWLVGIVMKVHEVVVGITISVLAGAIIMNVFKDELSEGKTSNYKAFASGVIVAAFLLVLIER